jgi:hypothetical protein
MFFHPHWGTLDDSMLTVQPGRRLDALGEFPSGIFFDMKRAGIFVWVLCLWHFFPNNPLGFYVVNCVLISAGAVLVYFASFILTRHFLLSAITACGIFLSSGFFEVAYTLDKQEAYLPLLFGAVLMCHLRAVYCRSRNLWALCVLDIICSVAAFVSKESALVLIVFSGSLMVLCALRTRLCKLVDSSDDFKRSLLLFACTILPVSVQHILPSTVATNSYVVIDFNAVKLATKGLQYCQAMPDFFLFLFLTLVGWTIQFIESRRNPLSLQFCFFTSLIISSVISTLALISFDTHHTLLLYIWLPIYSFLLPGLTCSLAWQTSVLSMFNKYSRYGFLTVLLLGLIGIQLPRQIIRAQFQYFMDELTGELSQRLSELARTSSTSMLGAMPLFSLGANEIPGHIEFFVRSKLNQNYYPTAEETSRKFKFAMLSCLTPNVAEQIADGALGKKFTFKDFNGNSNFYESECSANYVGWSGFQLLSRGVRPTWVRRNFDVGDLLLVPYGNVNPNIHHRGELLFETNWQFPLSAFPQLKFEEVSDVSREIIDSTGKPEHLGWKILRVIASCPVAMESCLHSLPNSGKLFYQYDPLKPFLCIEVASQAISPVIFLTYSSGIKATVASFKSGDVWQIQVPLLPASDKHIPYIQLSWPPGFADMTIKRLSMIPSASKVTDFYLSQEIDGWLKTNSVIVYPNTMYGKMLCLTVDMPGVANLRLTAKSCRSIKIENSIQTRVRIPLTGGLPTADGRSYLLIGSEHPLSIAGDPRQLLLHVSHYEVE